MRKKVFGPTAPKEAAEPLKSFEYYDLDGDKCEGRKVGPGDLMLTIWEDGAQSAVLIEKKDVGEFLDSLKGLTR